MGKPLEERLMSEYIDDHLRAARAETHVRLGWPKTIVARDAAAVKARSYLVAALLEADLVVRVGARVRIYEFTVWRPTAKVAQLLRYRLELPGTPGYEDVTPADVDLVLVTGLDDPGIRTFAESFGIRVEVYTPAWLERELAKRRGGPP